MYKFLGIQSRKDAADEYQPKGDYLSPSQYETKYGKVIDDKFKGYLPIGDYMLNDEAKFRNSKIWPPIQAELDGKYQPKGDYTLNSTFNAYKTSAANTYALASDLNAYKDTVGKTYQLKGDYTLNSDFNAYKDIVGKTYQLKGDYALNSDLNAYKDIVGKTYATNSDLNAYKDTVGKTYQLKGDYTLNSDLNAYKDSVGKTYATNADLNAYKDSVGKTYALASDLSKYQPKNDYTLNSDFNAYKDTVGQTYATNADLNAYKDTVANTYLTPSMYEEKYGKVIEDKLEGNLPVGNYLMRDDFIKAISAFTNEIDKKYEQKYVTQDQFNAYRGNNFVVRDELDQLRYSMNDNFNNVFQKLQEQQVQQPTKDMQQSPPSYLRHRNYMFYK